MRISNSYIGRPMERTEDLRFLRGRGTYVADVNRSRQLSAVILRSSVAHGRLRGIDASRALAIPGVHRVIGDLIRPSSQADIDIGAAWFLVDAVCEDDPTMLEKLLEKIEAKRRKLNEGGTS